MSLFHRRSRSASATRPQTTASPSAHVAATQAFLASRASQANLSASAAATALRNLTPTPTPVDQVQTKRMVQKRASLSSISSSARGRAGPLQRQSSSSSMTERTFRTPSPSPSRQAVRPEPVHQPPIPALPQSYANSPNAAPKAKKPKQRAASQDTSLLRLSSPPSTRQDQRGAGSDRFSELQSLEQQTPPTKRRPNLPASNLLERTDSKNSINFSRPLSPRPQSPTMSSPVTTKSPSMLTNGDRFPPNTAASLSPAQADDIQYGLIQAANQPVKKKKKKIAGHASEGSHLHEGTMASRPIVTPLEPAHERADLPLQEQQPSISKKKKKKAVVTGQNSHFPPADDARTDSDSDSNADRLREKRSQRASGVLQKQPSIVREDWEGEQHEQSGSTQGTQDTQPAPVRPQGVSATAAQARPLTAANMSAKIEEPTPVPGTLVQPTSANYHAVDVADQSDSPSSILSQPLQLQAPQTVRGSSLSPSRSTRFSDRLSSDLAAGRKHDPLPRSVSPAKSALKHHSPAPGGSPLDPNFNKARGASATPSEASDISTPDIDAPLKPKKSVRVSFDAGPEDSGQPETMESPNKEKKGWLGIGKAKPTLSTIPSNDDMEELMKPRPQLPSFGSVRGHKSRDTNDSGAQPTSSESRSRPTITESKPASSSIASSETSSGSYNNTTPTGLSSDHLVGAVLAQEAQRTSLQKSTSREPLPPEVTSVEGGVSFSDSDSDGSEEEEMQLSEDQKKSTREYVIAQRTVEAPRVNSTASPFVELPPQPSEVPVLSISPPTPALEQAQAKPSDQWQVEVPGGFPISMDALAQLNESNKSLAGTSPAHASKGLGVAAPSESESDNDSIYSDAAEDPSELDGTGFGSIDAIVDSPVVVSPSTRLPAVPESPLSRVVEPRTVEEGSLGPSWEATQARWNHIAEQSKQPPIQAPTQTAAQVQSVAPAQVQPATQVLQHLPPAVQPPQPGQSKRKKKKSAAHVPVPATTPAAIIAARGVVPESPVRQKNQGSAYPAIQQPRHDTSPPAQHFRQSMRTASPSAPEPTFRQSLRAENRQSVPVQAAVGQPKVKRFSQPVPPQVAAPEPRAALQKKHIPPQAAKAAAVPKPVPSVPTTNDSDSESSFRKARRSKSASGGKYTMRRSMRGATDVSSQPDARNGVRSVSPVGRKPFSPPTAPRAMRASMRGSMDNTPTLRGSTEAKRSSSLFGRRPSSQAPPMPSGASKLASKGRSRIVDSDDEDNVPRASKWRSRFADDSDDEGNAQFTPVRGIPRRANDSDSTDLEDSSDEEKVTVQAPAKLTIPSNDRPGSSGEALSPTSEKKRGLFGRFRSKKPKEEAVSAPVVELPSPKAKSEKTNATQLGFSSAAERDRIIEETRAKLEQAQYTQASPPASSHGKLQRRHIPQRVMSDSWPLPPKIPDHLDNRPGTAESAPVRNGTTRLAEGSMRGHHDLPPVGRSGKKKRFPMLRKAFGLKD